MNRLRIEKLLHEVRNDRISIDEALNRLRDLPFEDIGFAKVDHHRALRCGFPEVVFCQGKTRQQVVEILRRLSGEQTVLATRVDPATYRAIYQVFPDAEYNGLAGTVVLAGLNERQSVETKPILVCSAGTSDIPVAEEAAVTAETMGQRIDRLYDVGVAGLHRLLCNKPKLVGRNVLVVVAGMDGALPAVVSGLVDKPVIAVPTSVGYGASFAGVAPLLTMLNSCSPGVAVVNIDNGFGAGYFAAMINR
jgi:NCAIR mutase (PurE)-related protein